MENTGERVKSLIDLRENIIKKIDVCREEMEFLELNRDTIDSILKQSSFTKASALRTESSSTAKDVSQTEEQETIPITKDDNTIANAYVTTDKLSIVVNDGITLDPQTDPFQSFFIDNIIGDMKRKDEQEGIQDIIDCTIDKTGSNMREIIIKNYHNRERIDEIIKSVTWSFGKMLEKSEQ